MEGCFVLAFAILVVKKDEVIPAGMMSIEVDWQAIRRDQPIQRLPLDRFHGESGRRRILPPSTALQHSDG